MQTASQHESMAADALSAARATEHKGPSVEPAAEQPNEGQDAAKAQQGSQEMVQEKPQDSSGGQPAQPATSPAQDLDALRAELARNLAKIESTTLANQNLTRDIRDLERALTEADQLVEAYGQVLESRLRSERKDQQGYYDAKQKMAEAGVGKKKEAIDQAIAAFAEAQAAADKAVGAAADEIAKKQAARDAAQKAAEQALAHYDEAKSYRSNLEQKLRTLTDLRREIERADDAADAVRMYVLLWEFKPILQGIKLLEREEYRQQLYTLWTELNTKRDALRDREEELAAAKGAHDAAKKARDDLIAGRRQWILDKVGK
ncbi:MAG: hypothetical protein U1E38_06105 [Rhodospirillales bacterium]